MAEEDEELYEGTELDLIIDNGYESPDQQEMACAD